VATIVSFHAHPDDESIATGGTLAKAAAAGHRVVLVFATKGEHGEVDDGYLMPGEPLWQRREQETHRSAAVLGAHRVAFLGYVDSGMMGTPENDAPLAFWQADLDEAAGRLAAILSEEDAEVLTVYDDHGLYGHPDHINVHRVGVRAAELAGTPRVFEATVNRDDMRRRNEEAKAAGVDFGGEMSEEEMSSFGSPESAITTIVDVRDFLDQKRASMAAHASQIPESSFFLSLPPDLYEKVWGTECYIHRGVEPGGPVEGDLFD
jgi:LmbE family N-acetylglucosaminyl deacetylase